MGNGSLLVAAKVMYPAKSTKRFSWLTRSTSMLLMKNVLIYGSLQVVIQDVGKTYATNAATLNLLNANGLYTQTGAQGNFLNCP